MQSKEAILHKIYGDTADVVAGEMEHLKLIIELLVDIRELLRQDDNVSKWGPKL